MSAPVYKGTQQPKRRVITLASIHESALVIFAVGAVVAVVLGWVRDGSLGQAIIQAPLSPFAAGPAFVVVAAGVAQYATAYWQARQRYKVYQLKLQTLRGLLLDVRAPLVLRERAALAIARMDRETALATLREALSHPPAKATEENVERFADAISRALLVALGAAPSVVRLLDAAPANDIAASMTVKAGRDALFQLELHRRERIAKGYPTISLDVDAADAEAAVRALNLLEAYGARKRHAGEAKDVAAELLTAVEGELASTAGGRAWRNE